ncbi:MAG: hypothetical protein AAF677_05700 [Pseudomonadota bacterium]
MTANTAIASVAALLAVFAVPQAAMADRDQVVANFMQADGNADGALTLSEFTTLIDLNAASGIGRAAMIKRFGKYDVAFQRLDRDADGLVTAEEIQRLAQQAQR